MPAAGSKRCFYDTLGVSKDSDDKALKKAYRKLAIKWHPDKHVSESEAAQKRAEEQFKAVAEAYHVLSDTKKRQVYDQLGHAGLEGGMPEGGMGGGMGGFGFPGGGGGGSTFVFRSAGGGQGGGGVDPMQMFAQMFGDGMMGGVRADDRMGGAFGSSPFTSLFGSMGGGTGMGPASMGMGMGMGMGGGMGAGKRRRSAAGGGGDDDDGCGCLLQSGCTVRVRGLRNAPQHNGRTGVVERHDPAQNRYIVRLDGNGRPGSGSWSAGGGGGGGGAERLACRREHLLQMMRVQIAHLSSRPELNGRAATLLDFDSAKGRYVVQVEGGERLSLSRECVMLPEDASVLVGGLTSGAGSRLNGRSARVLGWADGRYTCAVTGGAAGGDLGPQLVKLKPSNCVA